MKEDKGNGKQAAVVAETVTSEARMPESTADTGNEVPETPGRVRAFMIAKFPDRAWKDQAELDNDVADWMEQADKSLSDYRTADETLRRIASEYPEIMAIAKDLSSDPGLPLGVAIRRNIDEDELDVEKDDPGYEGLRKMREERIARRKSQEEYRNRLDRNIEESSAVIQRYLADNGVSDDEAAALGKYIDDNMANFMEGRITADVLNMFRNALNYSKDVAEAREVGKVEGMNTRIDAERQRKKEATDGLPAPGSSTGVMSPPSRQEPEDIFDEIIRRGDRRRKLME